MSDLPSPLHPWFNDESAKVVLGDWQPRNWPAAHFLTLMSPKLSASKAGTKALKPVNRRRGLIAFPQGEVYALVWCDLFETARTPHIRHSDGIQSRRLRTGAHCHSSASPCTRVLLLVRMVSLPAQLFSIRLTRKTVPLLRCGAYAAAGIC